MTGLMQRERGKGGIDLCCNGAAGGGANKQNVKIEGWVASARDREVLSRAREKEVIELRRVAVAALCCEKENIDVCVVVATHLACPICCCDSGRHGCGQRRGRARGDGGSTG